MSLRSQQKYFRTSTSLSFTWLNVPQRSKNKLCEISYKLLQLFKLHLRNIFHSACIEFLFLLPKKGQPIQYYQPRYSRFTISLSEKKMEGRKPAFRMNWTQIQRTEVAKFYFFVCYYYKLWEDHIPQLASCGRRLNMIIQQILFSREASPSTN